MNNSPFFFLDQHGCSKNQVDGELLVTRLISKGWKRTDDAALASLIITNTCGFIESAKTESLQSLMEARSAYPNSKIILAGCLAERYADDFAETLPEADAIMGNGDLSVIDSVVDSLFVNSTSSSESKINKNSCCKESSRPVLKMPQEGVCAGERAEFLNFPGSAYVKITEGCNNCCSFCAIPLIRGSLRSRTQKEIVSEIETLLNRGVFEINLIGQDLAAFGRDGVPSGQSGNPCYKDEPSPLAELLKEISTIKGNFWVRLLYIHPDHFPFDILPIIRNDSRILPYFDIPFQSGSTSVINAMNRVGTTESYINLAKRLREEAADSTKGHDFAILRTTFLCGFPGETDDDAISTVDFLKTVEPDWSGCFTYSKEEDTVAYSMKKQISKKVAEKRTNTLRDIQTEITTKRLNKHVGKTYDVLIEEIIDDPENGTGLALGRAWFQAPEVDGAVIVRYDMENPTIVEQVRPGKIVSAKILSVTGVDLDSLIV